MFGTIWKPATFTLGRPVAYNECTPNKARDESQDDIGRGEKGGEAGAKSGRLPMSPLTMGLL